MVAQFQSTTYFHLVLLVNRATEDETTIEVYTRSDRFADVLLEVKRIRAERRLFGYEVEEVIEQPLPF